METNTAATGDPTEPVVSPAPEQEGAATTTQEKPSSRPLVILLSLTALVFVGMAFVAGWGAPIMAQMIPFTWEEGLIDESFFSTRLTAKNTAKQKELRRLAAAVAKEMNLPYGMEVKVHYHPGGTVNAFATLGGNIVVFQGILDLMESEDALVTVLAHEIAHIKNRDPIKGAVQVLGVDFLFSGLSDPGGYVETVAGAGMALYSRSQESTADQEAVRVLIKRYGHAGGAKDLLSTLARKVEQRDVSKEKAAFLPPIMASHPDTLARIDAAKREAADLNAPEEGDLTPLPEVLAK